MTTTDAAGSAAPGGTSPQQAAPAIQAPVYGVAHPIGGSPQVHELAITQSVVDAVLEKLPERQITVVSLAIGTLSGVEPDSVRFCFGLVTAGTALDGVELRISRPSGRAHCSSCQSDFDLDSCIMLCACGSADVRATSGHQLLISSVRVA